MAGQKVNRFPFDTTAPLQAQSAGPIDANLLEIPKRSKEIDCAGCGRPITVADRVCMAYCASCSADQGKKK